ncbi:hypothetical protein N790_02620 [Arenimonas malthae CC-JY-1]|uniref:Uncharacterized protein n=1 Tax=Arenimonas malthae CC-JY-1 TaxID=1384054 RepID=A0A091BFX8_9GAMM|nr:hypothetical protein N790_02620 [Arenimonas malthae CC-JY-1]
MAVVIDRYDAMLRHSREKMLKFVSRGRIPICVQAKVGDLFRSSTRDRFFDIALNIMDS